jgi:arylformamidase
VGAWIYLSHPLDVQTPAYGGGEGLEAVATRSMARGDSCNAARWSFSNHLGTHIDFPRHFSDEGKTLDDYPAGFWLFGAVTVVELQGLQPGGRIGVEDLEFETLPAETDLLLLKTGFGSQRGTSLYWENGPVFQPEIAEALRKKCPGIKVLGIDAISVSSWSDRDTGRQAHRAFLAHSRPILLLEDVDFSGINAQSCIERVLISPLRVAGADASPCTVLAEVRC